MEENRDGTREREEEGREGGRSSSSRSLSTSVTWSLNVRLFSENARTDGLRKTPGGSSQ